MLLVDRSCFSVLVFPVLSIVLRYMYGRSLSLSLSPSLSSPRPPTVPLTPPPLCIPHGPRIGICEQGPARHPRGKALTWARARLAENRDDHIKIKGPAPY